MNTEDLVRVSIAILLDLLLVLALISLSFVDNVVNQVLYNYGLTFSLDWAESYWLFMRASMVLIVIVIAVVSTTEILYPLSRRR